MADAADGNAADAEASTCSTEPVDAPHLRTERLLIRTVERADVDALVDRRNDPEVARLQSWALPYPREAGERLVAEVAAAGGLRDDTWWQGTLVELATDEIVGDVALRPSFAGRSMEVGYTLARAAWGRGLATEAVSAVVDHLLERGVRRLSAQLHPDNLASARLLERLGFRFEGHTRDSYWVGDECSDDWLYGLTATDRAEWLDRPTNRPREVRLVELTPDNVRAVRRLVTHKTQEAMVAPVGVSLADALVPAVIDGEACVPWYRAIEADGELVGFVMVAEATEDHPEPYLWRLLVDRRHQRRGIGAWALELVEQRWREAGIASATVSWVDGPGSPRPFYERRGYVPTGVVDHGEIQARLVL